jgi:hypothetical protein
MKKHLIAFLAMAVAIGLLTMGWAEMKKGMEFARDWTGYKHIGSLVITDRTSTLFGIHHFYMNNKGLEAFKKGGAYPDGTVIVDALYEAIEGLGGILNEGKKLGYPVMKKASKAADAKETGGWIFALFNADGQLLEKDVKKECFECHKAAKDSDCVFSRPLK